MIYTLQSGNCIAEFTVRPTYRWPNSCIKSIIPHNRLCPNCEKIWQFLEKGLEGFNNQELTFTEKFDDATIRQIALNVAEKIGVEVDETFCNPSDFSDTETAIFDPKKKRIKTIILQ